MEVTNIMLLMAMKKGTALGLFPENASHEAHLEHEFMMKQCLQAALDELSDAYIAENIAGLIKIANIYKRNNPDMEKQTAAKEKLLVMIHDQP